MQFFAVIAFFALELYLLVEVGSIIGAFNMVLWVFASAGIGFWAIRTQSRGALRRMQMDIAEGRAPQNAFTESVLPFLGGLLLILPGLISDAMGLLLLLPPVRRAIGGIFGRYAATRPASSFGGASRIIFFRGGGFPGGAGFGPGGPEFNADMRPPFERSRSAAPGAEDEPRQATIIESTAIEIHPENSNRDTAEKPDSNGKG